MQGAQLFCSSFENYKRLKKKVVSPIPDVERYFLKEPAKLIAPEAGKIRALTHILKRERRTVVGVRTLPGLVSQARL